jgi:TRAP-type C4-dicarboxylate transport system permease small subunit
MHATSFTAWSPMAGPARLRPLSALLAALDLAVAWTLCVAMAVMVVVVGAQVALRYGLNSSFDWADEVARLSFVWSIFLAIALGIKTGSHIGIEMVVAKFPAAVRGGVARIVALVCAAALLLVAWESAIVARDQWDELMGAVNVSSAWFLVPLVIGGVHGALHLLWITLNGPARGVAVAVGTE